MRILSYKLKGLEKLIRNHNRFVIFTHTGLDPDANGSSFGLNFIITENFKKHATSVLFEHPIEGLPVPPNTLVKPNTATLKQILNAADVVFILDVAEPHRVLPFDHAEIEKMIFSKQLVLIDHHATPIKIKIKSNNLIFRYVCSATATILSEIFVEKLKLKIGWKTAFNLATGILADTRGFKYLTNNRFSTCLLFKKLLKFSQNKFSIRDLYTVTEEKLFPETIGEIKTILEHLKIVGNIAYTFIDADEVKNPSRLQAIKLFTLHKILESIPGIHAFFFVYPKLGYKNLYSISFRSIPGVDVSRAAMALGGGGHKNASAAKLKAPNALNAAEKALTALHESGIK